MGTTEATDSHFKITLSPVVISQLHPNHTKSHSYHTKPIGNLLVFLCDEKEEISKLSSGLTLKTVWKSPLFRRIEKLRDFRLVWYGKNGSLCGWGVIVRLLLVKV